MQLPLRVRLYISAWSIFAAGAVIALWFSFPGFYYSAEFLEPIVILTGLLIVLQIYEVELVYRNALSTGIAICIASIVLGGAAIAVPVTVLGTLIAESILRWPYTKNGFTNYLYRVGFNTAQFTVAALAALGAYLLAGGQPLLLNELSQSSLIFYHHLIPAALAFLVFEVVNTFSVASIVTLTEQTSITYHLRFDIKHLSIQFLALGAVSILLPLVYVQSPWNLIPLLIPLGLIYVSLRNHMHLRYAAKESFEGLANMLAIRDPYTFDHSQDAADLAVDIARRLGLSEDRIDQVRSAAVIHDIGKIAISDDILKKPGPLDDQEWAEMKKHPDIGADLIKDLEIYRDVAEIVRCEHEKWDGSGYPKGLRGEEIPIEARIVTIADIYNALTTDRPYRKAFTQEKAVEMIKEMRDDRKLDPRVVDAFLEIMEEHAERYAPTSTDASD